MANVGTANERLKEIYKEQPRAGTVCYTVGLKQFGPSSIDIELRGYFHVYGYEAQVAAQHELLGNIIDLAKDLEASFAFPARTVHVAREDLPALAAPLQTAGPEKDGAKGAKDEAVADAGSDAERKD